MPAQRNQCPQRIVADGHARAVAAAESTVRAEVEAEFAQQWAEASRSGRFRLRRRIEREIAQRLDRLAPPDGLY